VDSTRTTEPEELLRGLAKGDETLLRSVLAISPARPSPRPVVSRRPLPPVTKSLVHLGALLAAGASTTTLRWAVELALQAGAQDDEIVEVLASVATIVGAARVVAAAPRLALAIGYDIEIEGWDGY
jgi:4-carboxymuconolactone decarboxylase